MSLTNPTLTKTWAKVAENTQSFTLTLPLNAGAAIEYVPMETDQSPAAGVIGGSLIPGEREGVTRDLTGPGYVYARIEPSQPVSSIKVVLMAWAT